MPRNSNSDAGSLGSIGAFKDVFVSNEKRIADRGKKYREAERLSKKVGGFLKRITDLGCIVVGDKSNIYVYAPDKDGVVVLEDGRKAVRVSAIGLNKTEVPF